MKVSSDAQDYKKLYSYGTFSQGGTQRCFPPKVGILKKMKAWINTRERKRNTQDDGESNF